MRNDLDGMCTNPTDMTTPGADLCDERGATARHTRAARARPPHSPASPVGICGGAAAGHLAGAETGASRVSECSADRPAAAEAEIVGQSGGDIGEGFAGAEGAVAAVVADEEGDFLAGVIVAR